MHTARDVLMLYLCKRRHDDRMIDQESRLHQIRLDYKPYTYIARTQDWMCNVNIFEKKNVRGFIEFIGIKLYLQLPTNKPTTQHTHEGS